MVKKVTIALILVLFSLIAVAEVMIGWGVRKVSTMAQEKFPGDRVQALIALTECETCSMNDRNRAVWTLGQLADSRALPVLEKYYTGEECNHATSLCQYELQKALKLTRKGYNLEKFLWQWMLPGDTGN